MIAITTSNSIKVKPLEREALKLGTNERKPILKCRIAKKSVWFFERISFVVGFLTSIKW